MKKLLLIGLVAVSSLFAIEDGNYKCVATKICAKDDMCKKLDINTAPTITLSITNNGRDLKDSDTNYKYFATYKDFDMFRNPVYTILMPTDDVNDSVFNAGMQTKKTGMQVFMACIRINKK